MVLPKIKDATKDPNGFELKTSPVISDEKPFSSAKGGKNGAMIETLITEKILSVRILELNLPRFNYLNRYLKKKNKI